MKRVLIVGHLQFTADVMRLALEHTIGVRLFGLFDDSRLADAVRDARPDIVVVDGVSAGARGVQQLGTIRAAATRALIVLAVAELDDRRTARALEAGAVVFRLPGGGIPAPDSGGTSGPTSVPARAADDRRRRFRRVDPGADAACEPAGPGAARARHALTSVAANRARDTVSTEQTGQSPTSP
jgi:chemotaxis response regulator CheB